MPSCVELSKISKAFAGVQALDAVDFSVEAGEIHALLGENGAGKSTLIKILTGAQTADSGTVSLHGEKISLSRPADARKHGISVVYQEVNLVPSMSVVANVMLGKEPRRFGLVNWPACRKLARERLSRLSLDINLDKPLNTYSVAVRQLVAIARALDAGTKVLVLDEPTASLDANETQMLFSVMRQLRQEGLAIVFITHFLDQVYEIADRITVLRNGRRVGTSAVAALSHKELVTMMLGKQLSEAEERQDKGGAGRQQVLLQAKGLGKRREMAAVDLEVAKGEAVGFSGLLGSGRTETLKLLIGAIKPDSGEVYLEGKPEGRLNPQKSLCQGIAFCPEDRKAEGIFASLSIRENIIIGLQARRGWLGRIGRKEQEKCAAEMIAAMAIATPDAEKAVGKLSGGNQQKVVLSRSLTSQPRVLILDEPTRGIDVGAHAEIVNLIRRLCRQGLGLLVASSELDELVAFSDRVIVLRDRKKVGELSGSEISRQRIIETIAGAG